MTKRHGVARPATEHAENAAWRVHFGMALWPYDLALRFSYDLPENEHIWADEWFDDTFEAAALDVRGAAAKLMIALREMDAALDELKARLDAPPAQLAATRDAVERAPLALDLVAHYLTRILDAAAAVVPTCYGQRGKSLAGARGGLLELSTATGLAELDPALPAILELPAAVSSLLTDDVATHSPDLYVVADSAGYAAALPRAAQRAMRTNAEVILDAGARIDEALRDSCAWLDALLDHLIETVCAQSEEGPELRERWARDDWSVLQELAAADAALQRRLPAV